MVGVQSCGEQPEVAGGVRGEGQPARTGNSNPIPFLWGGGILSHATKHLVKVFSPYNNTALIEIYLFRTALVMINTSI